MIRRILAAAAGEGRALLLIYHRVHAKADPLFPDEVDAARFDEQMSLLQRFCCPMPLTEIVRGLGRGSLPPTAVCVTFDDGYADNATIALPILRRHGIPATFFVATGFLDGGRMWNDTVVEAFRACRGSELDLTDLGLGRVQLGDGAERGRAALAVLSAIKRRRPRDREEISDEIGRRVGVPLPSDLMMTSQQVRGLADTGMEIGAHTHSHPILALLSDADARFEIEHNRTILERTTGRPVRSFAYPNGRPGEDYSPRDRDLVQELGLECAVSTRRGVATIRSDRFQLPRFTPWDRNPRKWFARLLLEFRRPG